MKQMFFVFLFCITAHLSAASGVVITDCVFDPDSLVFHLSWQTDSTAIAEGAYAGITARCGAGVTDTPYSSFRISKLADDTTFVIPDLRFDTVYTISLWTAFKGIYTAPDSFSIRVVRVESRSRQPVIFFEQGSSDTVKALHGQLKLWKGRDFPAGFPVRHDTVSVYAPPDSQLTGFASFGAGVRFFHPDPSPFLFLGLKFDNTGNDSYVKQARLYKDSAGLLLLMRDAVTDVEKGLVFVQTNDLRFPFVVLADTARPKITVLTDTSSCIDSISLTDSISVSDNCAAISWKFLCAAGNSGSLTAVSSKTLKARSGKIVCTIPPTGVLAAGVRALLIISDGTFIDTINLSRRAIRLHSDAVTTPARMIMPISSTAIPESNGIRNCLYSLFSNAGDSYNPAQWRIFRWLPEAANAALADKWVEYPGSADDTVFRFAPGKVFWLITNTSSVIDFGKSKTPTLKAPFSLSLAPHNWTDISVPFGFNVSLASVLDASGTWAEKAIIYRWIKDESNRTYRAQLVYGGKNVVSDSVADTLVSGIGTGYTVYNPFDTMVTLRFPPTPVSMQGIFKSFVTTKKINSVGYCVKVGVLQKSSEIEAAYCGAAGTSDILFSPPPPSFSNVKIRIQHPVTGAAGGILMYPSGNAVNVYPVEIFNGEDRAVSLELHASLLKSGPYIGYRMVKKHSQGYDSFENGSTINLEQGGKADYVVVAGALDKIDSYFASAPMFRENVISAVSVAVKNRLLHITFTSASSEDRCRFSIIDLRGQCIVNRELSLLDKTSVQVQIPHLASGCFLIKSTIFGKNRTMTEIRRIVLPE
jgi:hypothetical protein